MKLRIGFVVIVSLVVLASAILCGLLEIGSTAPPAYAQKTERLAAKGGVIFQERCAGCHYADKTATKKGPGLKGLFKRDKLPVSGRPVTEANVRAQLAKPFNQMPPMVDVKGADLAALLDYLKSL